MDSGPGNLIKRAGPLIRPKEIEKREWIKIGISDIRISEPDEANRVKVRFRQEYNSSNYSVKSIKTMVLIKAEERWEILSEESN
jgi:hypothetical protein